jgi:superfamily II DNA or RNA helicase
VAEDGILREIAERFTFEVPGYKFMPAFKNGSWDGKIRLFNPRDRKLYKGLSLELYRFCKDFEYEFMADRGHAHEQLSLSEANEFIARLNPTMEPRDYQFDTFVKGVREKRGIFLSATSSGKSFIIYMFATYFAEAGLRTLIVVPTKALVHQMTGDFVEYGCPENLVHKIFGGQEKTTKHPFTMSTWQSLVKLPASWFNTFDCIIGDEAHTFKAKSLIAIMEKATKVKYRYGFSGTLDDSQVNELVLTGLFGPVHRVISAKELMDRGDAARLVIKVLVLEYEDEERREVSKLDYQKEITWLLSHSARNEFIVNLAKSLKGNVLLAFQFIEKHGDILNEMLTESTTRPIYYVHGGVDAKERNDLRAIIEQEEEAIILGSAGTTSTGINVKRLHQLIFGSPSKAKIKVLQTIGRMIRKLAGKETVTLYDIADNLTKGSRENYSYRHLKERLKVYDSEGFDYKIYHVKVKRRK